MHMGSVGQWLVALPNYDDNGLHRFSHIMEGKPLECYGVGGGDPESGEGWWW